MSHQIGPIKIKPISMIIPPREKSKRTLFKKGKPVREEAGGSAGTAEQMAEEPSVKGGKQKGCMKPCVEHKTLGKRQPTKGKKIL